MSAPAAREALFSALDALGIPPRTVEHAAGFTVAASKSIKADMPGGHTKNLFVKDKKGRLFLVTALSDAVIDLKRLHEAIGASGRVSFGSAELLRDRLGVEPGSVTPLAAINDRDGAVHDPVNVHPLANTATTALAPGDLVRFLESTGHVPRVLALPVPADAAG